MIDALPGYIDILLNERWIMAGKKAEAPPI